MIGKIDYQLTNIELDSVSLPSSSASFIPGEGISVGMYVYGV